MEGIKFLFQITLIVLLWSSLWGLMDISIDCLCEDNKKHRVMIYVGVILLLVLLYSINPAHFIHA